MAGKAANDNSALPRWMTRAMLARDLCVSEDTVDALVAQGKLPKPVYLTPRLPRWDRHAVDEALGVARTMGDSQFADEVFNALTRAKRPKGQKAARGRNR